MPYVWSTVPTENDQDVPDRVDLPKGEWLVILADYTDPPLQTVKDGKDKVQLVITFEEVTANLTQGRTKPYFIELEGFDGNWQPSPRFAGQGSWNKLLTGLGIPRTHARYPLENLLTRPIRVWIGDPPKDFKRGFIDKFLPLKENDDKLAMAYTDKWYPLPDDPSPVTRNP